MFLLSSTTCFLIAVTFVALILILLDHVISKKALSKIVDSEESMLPSPPGPKPWPIIGSLHIFGRYEVPYQAFGDLVKQYGCKIIKLRLGSTPCVVVTGLENIKEVLVTKGQHFDSRPNFVRLKVIFGGNRDNSLAFCTWSDVQKARRDMMISHTFPRAFTARFNELNGVIGNELEYLVNNVNSQAGKPVEAKPLILMACANILLEYFASTRFEPDFKPFLEVLHNFELLFYDVNQGYAVDFIPSLAPLQPRYMAKLDRWSNNIRNFVIKYVIADRREKWSPDLPNLDYVDTLITHIKTGAEPKMCWEAGLYVVEDIIGGHSAIGNLLMKVLGMLGPRMDIQRTVQEQIDALHIPTTYVGLEHRGSLPLVEGITLEVLRLLSSPIIPHVASQDSSIGGFRVEKDTFIFLDNYGLNMSEELWTAPKEFNPHRFVKDGRLQKPEHFLPFGGGRRSCMGYKLVQYVTFMTVATLLKNFTIQPIESEDYTVKMGNLALPESTYKFYFVKR